ncbi:MAG: hypothetical protein V3U88_03435 [Methylococcales bacterium]
MPNRISEQEHSVLIVAHPDDEVLWFSSLLSEIDQVIIIFRDYDQQPDIGKLRTEAITALPFKVVCLGISEAGSYALADWAKPEMSPYGLSLESITPNISVTQNYERNFGLIRSQLKTLLSPKMNVFTHNPWGEYGHEDHVQLYRIINNLRTEMNFKMWVSCYISKRSTLLARNYVESGVLEPIKCCINTKLAKEIANIYKCHHCWTWTDDWVWNQSEYFLPNPRLLLSGDKSPSLLYSNQLQRIPSQFNANST